jgi:hypothetical protein
VILYPGMLIKTNYSGPYRIKSIKRDCTCPSYLDQINSRNPQQRPKHLEMVVTRPDGSGEFYLGGYIEETLQSLSKSYCGKKQELDHDVIIVIDQDKPVQMRLW